MATARAPEGEAQFTEESPGDHPCLSLSLAVFLSFSLVFLNGFSLACVKFSFDQTGIDGLGGLKLTSGTRVPGTTFKTRKDDKVIFCSCCRNIIKKMRKSRRSAIFLSYYITCNSLFYNHSSVSLTMFLFLQSLSLQRSFALLPLFSLFG